MEISRLTKSHGVPRWSLKSRFVSDEDIISVLTNTEFKKVTSYPCNLSHPILFFFAGGGTTPWGQIVGGNSKYLSVMSRNQDYLPMPEMGEENNPAFVGQLSKYPGVYFVRCGKSVVACTSDGWVMQYASDER